MAKGGTLSQYLSSLRSMDYIAEENARVRLTDAGRRCAPGMAPPFTPEQVVALHNPKLKAGARRMLDVLMRAHPDGFTRSELSGLSGVAKGGTLSQYLSSLRARGLIEERARRVYAGGVLYLGEG